MKKFLKALLEAIWVGGSMAVGGLVFCWSIDWATEVTRSQAFAAMFCLYGSFLLFWVVPYALYKEHLRANKNKNSDKDI